MAEFGNVRRKIVGWREYVPDPTYFAKLACGHEIPGAYDDGMTAETRALLEEEGDPICDTCTRIEREIALAKERLREAESKRKPTE